VGPRPYLRPLARVRDEHARAAAVVLDKQRARLFLIQLGHLEEVADIIEDVPGHHKQGGWSQMRFQRHHDAHVVWHAGAVAHASQLLLERVEARHLFVAGTPQVLAEYREHLPAAAARLWRGEFAVSIEAPALQVKAALAPLLAGAEAEEERNAIERLNNSVSADRGVWGLRSVLRASAERRLRTLIVHDRYRAPGMECPRCGGLYPQRETACPADQSPLLPVEDVVDALLEAAAAQEADLELVHSDSGRALLPEVEPVGALLRF
jgi:peptide chain release factor subunit 1